MSAGASVHSVICWDFKWGLGATNQLASDLSQARFLSPFLQLLNLAVNFVSFCLRI
ncbi:rCG56790 [Rattus norvegicus]|uniref:RCG56790 n=1 Tax=Rattus norvegicus TaxID=10116 RepID=A6KUL2_RAT|nr:rCG56790 [Rattus norvegicus]